MSFSQFFILTVVGDVIIFKDYRNDVAKLSTDQFFSRVSTHASKSVEDIEPVFQVEDVHFVYQKIGGIYVVLTTRYNISPMLAMSLISHITHAIKDFCGVLTEESIRQNFAMVYELIDEIMEFGFPQTTDSQALKPLVFNQPVQINAPSWMNFDVFSSTKSSESAKRPISVTLDDQLESKNEIYVDLIERLTLLFNSSGEVLRNELDGALVLKSYLRGEPEVHISMNSDFVVAGSATHQQQRENQINLSERAVVDDIVFNHIVRHETFERTQSLTVKPPEGESTVFRYRISHSSFEIPLRITPSVEILSDTRADIIIRLRVETPNEKHVSNVIVSLPLDPAINSVSFNMTTQQQEEMGIVTEFRRTDHVALWHIDRMEAREQITLHAKLNWDDPSAIRNLRRQAGPISVDFELPLHLCSNVRIKQLRIVERDPDYDPQKWIRYVTQVRSYVCRLT